MITFNEIDTSKLSVGQRVEFLYKSSSPGSGKGTPSITKIKIRIKDEVFGDSIQKIVDNYQNKIEENNKIKSHLRAKWITISALKEGKQTKEVKAQLKSIRDSIKEYKATNKPTPLTNDLVFFKNYTKKELVESECYKVVVWYGGKSLDIRNGRESDCWITNEGYIDEEKFDKGTMVKL